MPDPVSAPRAQLVLTVDDAPEDRQMLKRFLTREPPPLYRVAEAWGISQALQVAAQERPDCVVLDFNLIDGDGMKLLRELTAAFGAHAFGVIMLTGSGEASVAVEAMKSGAHDYVEKNGLTAAGLRRTVANAIEKAAIQRELAERRQQLAQKNAELAAHVRQLQYEAAERARAEAAAGAAALQMRTVTDHLPVSVAQFDRNYRYRFANANLALRFGRTPEEIVGRTVAEVLGEKVFNTYRERMDAALAGKRLEFEASVASPDGERWMNVTYVPERDTSGAVIGFVAVSSDITERRQAEIAVAQARDQAVAATQARDSFLAALSHELRTPLNPVLLLASEAADNPALEEGVRADFTAIRNHVELEARLIDDLLDLSRISHGKLALHRRVLDVNVVLKNALSIIHAETQQKRVQVRLQLAREEAWVNADEVRLQQVFWNVLKNAVKFTPADGRVDIASAVDAARNVAIVRISDTGIGLSAEEATRIFDAFSQGDHAQNGGSHRFGGLGLGLAITRTLVDAHGGTIAVASPGANQGATFTIELPLAVARAAAPADAASPGAVRSAAPFEKGERRSVLLVEDHPSTRASLKALLERRGFAVTATASVEEARSAAAARDFALVISDIGLPDGDGYACMQALRQIRPNLRGIALSGYGMEEDRRRSREVGFTEHLIKPVNVSALDQAIARVLEVAVA